MTTANRTLSKAKKAKQDEFYTQLGDIENELKHYKKDSPVFLSVRPGLTGLWQVSGRSDLNYEERVNLDIYYVQNWSFWLDIKVLIRTIFVVLKRRGAE